MLTRIAAAAIIIMAGLCGLSPVDGQILIGRVKSAATGEPISGVSLIIKGTTKGTATGPEGSFSLSLSDVPAVLVVSHLSYKTLEINFTEFPEGKIDITLEQAFHSLDEVQITEPKVEKMMPGKPWEVMDYEFIGDSILLLANMNGSIFHPCLILINREGDTLAHLELAKGDELYKDFESKIQLVGGQSVYQVGVEDSKLILNYTCDKGSFFDTYPLVVDVRQPWWVIKAYASMGQKLKYYRYNETDSSLSELCTVVNQDAVERAQWGSYFDGTEADNHFAQLIINRPLFAPMFRLDEELVLFNYYSRTIEFFDREGERSRLLDAPFMKDRRCSELILQDAESGIFYTVYEKNGLSSLYMIGLVSGEATFAGSIPGFIYIENIQVNDGYAYFLYREKNLGEQKRLFRIKVN